MKIIRKILSFIMSIILFILILTFSLNLIIKGVVQKQIISGVAKNQIINEYIENSEIDNKKEIKKILNDSDASKVAYLIVDEYMKYAEDNNYKVSKKTVQEIIDFFVKHREKLNELSNSNITEEELKSQETFNNIEKGLNDEFETVNDDIGEQASTVIRVYSKLISNNFQIILIISIMIVIILLMLIKNSLYSWMSTFGYSLISVGIMMCSLFIFINMIIQKIKSRLEYNIDIKLSDILKIGIIEIVIGIILIISKIIIKKIKCNLSKTASKNFVSSSVSDPTNHMIEEQTEIYSDEPTNNDLESKNKE